MSEIFIDIGFWFLIIGAIFATYIHCKLLKLGMSFWEYFFMIESVRYWHEYPDFKNRFIDVLSSVLLFLGIIFVIIGICLK